MIVHQIFAQIYEEKVQGIYVYDGGYSEADLITKCIFGQEAFAVECTHIPCKVGDTYRNGSFFRENENGDLTIIMSLPSSEDEITKLESIIADLAEYQLDLEYRLSVYEFSNINKE